MSCGGAHGIERPSPWKLLLAAVLVGLLAIGGCAEGPGPDPRLSEVREPARPAPDEALVEELRGGGFVIYFRNAATEPGGADGPENLGNRSEQRNLSEEGRAEAEAIGEAFRRLGIPVGEVLSSPYFRALDTAEIAFGRAETTNDLLGVHPREGDAERARRENGLLRLLSTPPEGDADTVLVGHSSKTEDYAGITPDEGEAAVIEPLGEGEFEFVTRVAPEQWTELSRSE